MRLAYAFVAAVLGSCGAVAADCGTGATLGDALQGCVNKDIAIFYGVPDAKGRYNGAAGTVVSAGSDFVTISNTNNKVTTLTIVRYSTIQYIKYQP